MWAFFAAYGPIVLAVMGIAVSFAPKLTGEVWARWVIVAVFIVIGTLTAEGTRRESNRASRLQQQALDLERNLNRQIIGSRNYIVIVPAVTNFKDLTGSFPLLAFNPDKLPANDVSLIILRLPSQFKTAEDFNAINPFVVPQIYLGTVLPDNVHMQVPGAHLSLGKYEIKIRTKGGLFAERLILFNQNGEVRVRYYITKDGSTKKLFSSD